MKPGGWLRGGLAVCLALCLWACTPASLTPEVTASPTAEPLPQASITPVPPTPVQPAPAVTAVPLITLALTAAPATPTANPDPNLLAQYAPWSLGHAAAWSPGGDVLAVSAGEVVYFYDRHSLQEQGQIDLGAWGAGLAFNPVDENLLAVAGRDGALQLWDVAKQQRLATQAAHARGVNSLAFSPDGLYLASTGNDAMVRLWQVSALLSGEPVQPQAVMIGGASAVPAIRYSPDGALVASIDLQVVRLRDPLTQRLARTLYGENSMFTLAFSPDGQWLAAGELGSQVRVWNAATGEETMLLTADAADADPARAFVWSLDFSADGRLLAAGSSAGTLTVWSLPAGEVVSVIRAHSKAVSGLAFDPLEPRLASCGLDAAVRIWSIP